MHKYWGKKPSKDLNVLIDRYSEQNEILLDPFAGYGVFCIEAYLTGRKVILNDLNPIASFIQNSVLERDVDLHKMKDEWKLIKKAVGQYIDDWFSLDVQGQKKIAITVLRDRDDKIIKCKYLSNDKKNPEYSYTEDEISTFQKMEKKFNITKWYPKNTLFENSRITVKKGTTIKDLFTKRTLDCHSILFEAINKHSSGNEQNLFHLAFTANLANCSRLVPPIKSRGEMAPGAWMTGFYTGKTYLENNVLHYFENRLNKIFKGKQEYLQQFDNLFSSLDDPKSGKRFSFGELASDKSPGYYIQTKDVKFLNLDDECIDYIFTDPPYGDSVPYFEQSIIWNSWFENQVDYHNEIVISDSKARDKSKKSYSEDIQKAIAEIYRVLKYDKYFSITFHSLSGLEWNAINNACLKSGFAFHEFSWLVQKTFTPRQLNRAKSVKGDVLITFQKVRKPEILKNPSALDIRDIIRRWITELISKRPQKTNDIFLDIVKYIYKERVLIKDLNFFNILNEMAEFENGFWRLK